jgi:hypothetical protein
MKATVPYTLRTGVAIAADWDDLTDGALAAAINVTETGAVASPSGVWTNTKTDGTVLGGPDCGDWLIGTSATNGSFGSLTRSDSGWTDLSLGICGPPPDGVSGQRLYCFQQD